MKKRKLKNIKLHHIILLLTLMLGAALIFSQWVPNTLRWSILIFSSVYGFFGKGFRTNKYPKFASIYALVLLMLIGLVVPTEARFQSLLQGIHHGSQKVEVNFVVTKVSETTDLESLEKFNLGLLKDESSAAGYLVPRQILNDLALDYTSKLYSDYGAMIQALLEGKIDVAVLPEGYKTTLGSIETLSDALDQIKTIYRESRVEEVALESVNQDVLNIVLIGGDNPIVGQSTSGFNYDVIVVLSMNFKTHESALLSIPRDSYIYTTCTQKKDKITHSGWIGASCLTDTLSRFLGIELTYYALVDFKGLITLVDALGGVEIDVPQVIDEQDENRNFENMIHLEPGLQTLNGQEALAFLRHRHTLEGGAIARSTNHQVFLEAIFKKVANPLFLFKLNPLLKAIETSVLTNLRPQDAVLYYQKGLSWLDFGSLSANLPTSLSLSGSGQMIYTPSFGGNLYYYVLNKDSVEAAKTAFQNVQILH